MKFSIKANKGRIIIIVLALIGVFLIIFSSISSNEVKESDTFSPYHYTESLEKKIEAFLKEVQGIKNAKVIITLENSSEQIYAKNESSLDFILSGNGDPISITEIYPQVRGIAIACTNGDRADVKKDITELISSYLGISSNRIKIVPLR